MQGLLQAYRNKVTNKLFGVVHSPHFGQKKGDALLSYITSPFTLAPGEQMTDPHTNYWECMEIARLLNQKGYDVDIINSTNTSFIPKKKYSLIIDTHKNLERLHTFFPENCVKVMHITFANPEFQNKKEAERLENLFRRRGINLKPQRKVDVSNNAAFADYLVGFSSDYIKETYEKFKKEITPIPISVSKIFDFPEEKNYELAKKHFMWFGGGGAVHKGLDLTIEAFASMSNYHLSVIGPAVWEKDFREVYREEILNPNITLYHRPRITKDGVMMIDDTKFIDVAKTCGAIIFPSCSESASGSVIQAMHAGLIPIVTKEASISNESGALTIEATVESIKNKVKEFAHMHTNELEKASRHSWEYVRKHHTKESFTLAYNSFLDKILP